MTAVDAAATLKQLSAELQQRFDQSGMERVAKFVDVLDETAKRLQAGPGELMQTARAKVEDLRAKLQAALDDPSSLAPPGGMAGCARAYGQCVAGRLGALGGEAGQLAGSVQQLAGEVQGPLKEVGETLKGALAQLDGSVKALAKLPELVSAQVQQVQGPQDVARIDTAPLKQALAVGDLDAPLAAVLGLRAKLVPAVEAMKKVLGAVQSFVDSAPDQVRHAFDLPPPLCFLTSLLLGQAPKALGDLLGVVDGLKAVQLQPLLDALTGAEAAVANLQVDAIKAPLASFRTSAQEIVEKIDRAVQGAKLAADPAGAAKGVAERLGRLFH